MNELHLFAGCGGGILGGMLCGHRTVCAVEYSSFCRDVLLQRQRDGILPWFPIWDDVRTFNAREWRGRVDVVAGGFPCQRFSTATRGNPTAEDLWPEMLRIVDAIRSPFVFAENVSRAAIEIAAEDLEGLGYKCRAIPLSAEDMGADHIRRRYWLLGYSDCDSQSRRAIDDETRRLSELRAGVWETNLEDLRVVDGVASELDRTRASGNGQVPIVAATAWRALIA